MPLCCVFLWSRSFRTSVSVAVSGHELHSNLDGFLYSGSAASRKNPNINVPLATHNLFNLSIQQLKSNISCSELSFYREYVQVAFQACEQECRTFMYLIHTNQSIVVHLSYTSLQYLELDWMTEDLLNQVSYMCICNPVWLSWKTGFC